MNVYLLRCGLGDAHLTLEGRRVIRSAATTFQKLESVSFDRVLTSPLGPCVQTAELFAERVDYLGVVEVTASLAAGAPPELAARQVLSAGESVLVVADEPALAALGAFLVGRPTFPPHLHGQLSAIANRQPAFCLRPGETERALLLLA